MDLGGMISLRRKQRNLTIEELAKKSGVPKGTLNKIINGVTKDPQLETVRAIANALECSLDDLDDNSNVYVLSGSGNMLLDADEKELIKKYRDLDDRGKSMVMCLIDKENAYLDEEVETFAIADTGQQKSTKITRRKAIEARKQWLMMKEDAYDELRRALEGEFEPDEDTNPDIPGTKE